MIAEKIYDQLMKLAGPKNIAVRIELVGNGVELIDDETQKTLYEGDADGALDFLS